MADWGKLNKEFDDLMGNLTDADWIKWKENKEVKRNIRRMNLTLKAKIQEQRIIQKSLAHSGTFVRLNLTSAALPFNVKISEITKPTICYSVTPSVVSEILKSTMSEENYNNKFPMAA